MNSYLAKLGDCSSYSLKVIVGGVHPRLLALRPLQMLCLNSVKGSGKVLYKSSGLHFTFIHFDTAKPNLFINFIMRLVTWVLTTIMDLENDTALLASRKGMLREYQKINNNSIPRVLLRILQFV